MWNSQLSYSVRTSVGRNPQVMCVPVSWWAVLKGCSQASTACEAENWPQGKLLQILGRGVQQPVFEQVFSSNSIVLGRLAAIDL